MTEEKKEKAMKKSWFRRKYDHIKIQVKSLLLMGLTPNKLATGITVGFIIGTFPIWGTHTIMGILIAYIFRLNQVAVNIGVWVSFPAYLAGIVPCLRLGEWLFQAPQLDGETFINILKKMITSWDSFTNSLQQYGASLFHLHVGWLIAVIPICIPLFFIIQSIVKRIKLPTQKVEAENE